MADSILDINEILKNYTNDIEEKMYEDAIKLSKQGSEELKLTSPKHTGKYAKSWRVKTSKKGGFVNCTIYNTKYRLTHLLERRHVIRNQYGVWGTWYPPKEHIAPVDKKITQQYYDDLVKYIKNGG